MFVHLLIITIENKNRFKTISRKKLLIIIESNFVNLFGFVSLKRNLKKYCKKFFF